MDAVYCGEALLPEGWMQGVRIVAGADGAIESVDFNTAARPGDEIVDAAIPGMVNLHSHAFQRGMAGLAEVRAPGMDSFWTWREVMYRFLDRLGPEEIEATAAQAYVEMLEAGFTRVSEFHYLHHDAGGAPFANPAENAVRIVSAAEQTGIGLTLLPAFYAHGGFGNQPIGQAQRRLVNSRDGFARLMEASRRAVSRLPHGVVGVAPHSLRAAAIDELDTAVELAAGGPVHIHVAEQVKEVDECVAFYGARPVEWLLSNQNVDARWCLIHSTHMTEQETVALARSGAVVGLCPITEANLGDGVFNGSMYLQARGAFGIGTDSNVSIDMAGELRLLEYSQRLAQRTRNVFAMQPGASTGRGLFDAALAGGHQAAGLQKTGLARGASADIVSLDLEHPAFCGRRGDSILDSLIFAAREGAIDRVWCAGRKVVSAGRHHNCESIGARFREVMQRVLMS
jgi:formiminoglutamate deiminase